MAAQFPPPAPAPPGPPARRTGLVAAAIVAGVVIVAGIVAGVILLAGGSSKPGPAPHPRPQAPRLASFAVNATSPIRVDLQWQPVAGSVTKFSIYRNGNLLTSLSGDTHSYSDRAVLPGHNYRYAIEAADDAGRRSAQIEASTTTPPPPPVSTARLQGRFSIRAKYVRENYTNRNEGDVVSLTWSFAPTCGDGACRTKVSIGAPQQRIAPMAHSGANYSVKGTAQLTTCFSAHLTTTVTIRVRVTAARYIEGVWRASAITGTLTEYTAATSSCQVGSSTQSLTGHAQT